MLSTVGISRAAYVKTGKNPSLEGRERNYALQTLS